VISTPSFLRSIFVLFWRINLRAIKRETVGPMNAEELVLAILAALPNKEVHGKKRLQKLAFLAKEAGAPTDAHFFLHDYGPFSTDIANATEILSHVGAIQEKEAQSSKTRLFYSVYRLADTEDVQKELLAAIRDSLRELDRYSTIELEIASTIRYFLKEGSSAENAIRKTKEIKPTKSTIHIVNRAKEALERVGLYERGRANQVPRTRPN
jgi:uncharacterized protein